MESLNPPTPPPPPPPSSSTPSIPPPQLPASCGPPSPQRPPPQQVWVIFGATGHLGRSICRVALARGDCVTAVGRNIPAEEASMHGWHKRCQGLVCDVRDRATIEKAWEAAREYWGRVDVVVNLMFELEPLNIHVTLVEPGPSRRDEPDENINGPSPMWGHFLMKPPTDAYRATTSPAQHATRMVDWLRFRQPTSAVRIAKMVWELGHCTLPPLRLLLGSHAVESIRDRLRSTIEEIEDWKQLNAPSAGVEVGGGGGGGEEGGVVMGREW
ncbi:hypothetical protein K440DRAFT_623994 [Wilcoxina mikolae CBS 423.85]|nr:hypothetical protein K440DRAFT_623994 [Wilcoxina mikolae CBS 423.85]